MCKSIAGLLTFVSLNNIPLWVGVLTGGLPRGKMKINRSRWEIILDILKVTKKDGKVKRTRIMQMANLDWRNFQRYFDFLQAEGFIRMSNPDPEYYELTEKGIDLLNRLKDMSKTNQPFSAILHK